MRVLPLVAAFSLLQVVPALAAPSINVASWFNGDDPAFDGTGNGHDLVLTGLDTARAGRTVGGWGAIGFDGVASNGATTAKVVEGGEGISVSAWVRLTDDSVSRTVISQQGQAESAFRLGYDAVSHKWTFALAERDAADSAQRTAKSNAPAAKGVWTHVAGTYDNSSREVRLYVDGVAQNKVALVRNGFAAEGELWIGKALRGSAATEAWHGDLSEVRAWNSAITPEEVREMTEASGVGEWKFNEGSGSFARDSSPYARDLVLSGGAKWGQGVGGAGGVELVGGTSAVNASEPVLYTDQSFTVDVWAKLAETGTARTILAQRGPSGVDPFTLRYDGERWSAEMPDAAVNPSKYWRATGTAVANKWTHLVVTYNASTRTLTLTVGYQDTADTQKSTVTCVAGWNSTGVLSVGRGSTGESFLGNIDELKILQGPQA
ncbi:LamG domain-containing protein [Lentzea sp. NPDC051838]|uniref:LamG domain-containing protein n=1 Tax=Lentzea sp. NPDC051838 TaxID=3154849 RepID=UPI003438BE79